MNSPFFYILVINLAVFGANAWFFVDPDEPIAIEKPIEINNEEVDENTTNIKNNEDAKPITIDDILLNLTAAETLAVIKSQSEAQQKIETLKAQLQSELKKETQRQLGQQLQEAKLATLMKENLRLSDKVSTLDNQVNIQESYLAESLKREKKLNQALQKELLKHASLLSSPIDKIKTSIDQKSDLLKIKKTPQGKDAISDAEFIDVAIQTNNIQTDIVDGNEEAILDEKYFSGAVEFGFNYEQENELTKSAEGRLILDYNVVDQYNINSDIKFEFEDEEDEETENEWRWQLQGNYNLDPVNLIFLRSDIQRSESASYGKEDTFTTGYGHIFFNKNNHKFNTEFGPGYKLADPNDGEDEVSFNEFIIRTKLNYERIVTESLQVTLGSVFELGHKNSVYEVEFKAQNRIYQELYLIFDINYKYNQNVPEGTENDELSTGFNLQYAF
ncbi:DUF481 domain-containing protein [Psychromonas sp. SP041]|uniref:DUF481 domain-containing protein n=1 Tax=Psychromonas sp. SP041 TaxID=1365007 RepID=UPI000413CA84|nr:DUF481 domain-containing protein [Psychromonas sp. SP041]